MNEFARFTLAASKIIVFGLVIWGIFLILGILPNWLNWIALIAFGLTYLGIGRLWWEIRAFNASGRRRFVINPYGTRIERMIWTIGWLPLVVCILFKEYVASPIVSYLKELLDELKFFSRKKRKVKLCNIKCCIVLLFGLIK